MRLSPHEHICIKSTILKQNPITKVYLFGSRTDDTKKGGDIDILIISDKLTLQDIVEIKKNRNYSGE